MEALWSLEEKWKLTTQEAVIVFVCAASAIVGLCAATVLKKNARKKQVVDGDAVGDGSMNAKWCEPGCSWVSKKVLMGSVMWSGAKRWRERSFRWEERPPPLLRLEEYGDSVGWRSHNSDSPVWQRPILMGEKCELPRFSGLILYDERGQLLDDSVKRLPDQANDNQGTK
ncbi:transmembrane protein [Gossypium australe]|uniref:Transmembrane protein n=1 Tax=Gossypium australe TaxID=47621 RepID=A0A5B6VTH5_9ROSI|nr:transmembrane protein [Gossypium australe]